MFKMYIKRKICRNRKYMYTGILVSAGCFYYLFYLLLFFREPDYYDNKFKIAVIEESIKSLGNDGECKIPEVPIDNPEIMKFYHESPPLDCGNKDDDWVTCEKSVCFVKPNIIVEKGGITCSYTDLIRKTDYKVKHGHTTHTNTNYILQKSDFAKVFCKAENGERWSGIAIGIRDSVKRPNTNPQPLLNVLMLGFDSLSRNAFIRKLPKTYKYLTKELNAIVLKGYNIIGDGTPQALIPILTGHTELELPETRKRMRDSHYVNVYPMIWKDYEKNGYMTSFNEDIPQTGTFTYRLNGFDEQPTDHYMRTFYLEVRNFLSTSSEFCIGHQFGHEVMLNYTKNFLLKYNNNPTFVFSFHGELSHNAINLIGVADNDIENWLKELKRKGALDNTALILMSDHGNRFAEVRNTLQGKQEERLPFFSFSFPPWFQTKFEKEYKNIVTNAERLTTPFDIHETLLDILRIQSLEPLPPSPEQKTERAISLFKPISKGRSCADAYIEPHWCACLNWRQINDTSSTIVKLIAYSIVDKINSLTEPQRDICEWLELKEINWALKLVPREDLLKFKKNRDVDGFLGDFTSETKLNFEIYQVKIIVNPGNSIFEASVSRNLNTNRFDVKSSDISRVNMYGSQANCIYESHPELRKYCFCKK